MADKTMRARLLAELKEAPDEALFSQDAVAAVRDCSIATIERDRWAGTGVPFIKGARSVRYRKRDIFEWLGEQRSVRSTTEAAGARQTGPGK